MVKLSDITKDIKDVAACPRMKFAIDEELLKDIARELKRRKTDSIAIPKEDFLPAFGRKKDDPTSMSSVSYCLNEHLRDPGKPYRKFGIKIGIHTDRPTGKKYFKFIVVNWDTWDEEHTRKEEE